jgi:hypothetical protein
MNEYTNSHKHIHISFLGIRAKQLYMYFTYTFVIQIFLIIFYLEKHTSKIIGKQIKVVFLVIQVGENLSISHTVANVEIFQFSLVVITSS